MARETHTPSNGHPHDPAPPLVSATPSWLRPARAVAGVVLLTLSWGTTMLAFWLAANTFGIPPHRHPYVRVALYVLGALGTCWLGITALAAVLAGAFCLMLALTSRTW